MDDEGWAEVGKLFNDEARRRLERVRAILADGVPEPHTHERAELWRHMHSLKGTAGSLGLRRIEELAEDIAQRLAPEGPTAQEPVTPESADVVRREAVQLESELDALNHSR